MANKREGTFARLPKGQKTKYRDMAPLAISTISFLGTAPLLEKPA
jgi:hypothetical protein